MTPRKALLSKLRRRQRALTFALLATRNALVWERVDLERDVLAARCRELNWALFDVEDEIHALLHWHLE